MVSEVSSSVQPNWLESSGINHLLRTFRLAIRPNVLVLALAGLFVTLCWGIVLDWMWTSTDHGVPLNATARYVAGPLAHPPSGDTVGVSRAFRVFVFHCLRDGIESVRFGRIIGPVHLGQPVPVSLDPLAAAPVRGAFTDLVLLGRGFVWLLSQHPFYAILFILLVVPAWALCGGAACRILAFQFARDESVGVRESLRFAWDKFLGGFVLAPFMPLLFMGITALLLVVGGLILTIPWLGDLIGGLLYGLALLGGLVMALLTVGMVTGGCLFWPTIAVEASDAFDAVSRSLSYVFGRPLRAIWYTLVLVVYGSFSWLLVRFLVWLVLASAHVWVGFGAGLVGGPDDAAHKMIRLIDPPTFETLLSMSGTLPTHEWIARGLIGLWMLPVVGLTWAFLVTFFLAGSTVVYFLLRRDVDGTEISEVYSEDEDEEAFKGETVTAAESPSPTGAAQSSNDVSLPVAGAGSSAPSAPSAAPSSNPIASSVETFRSNDARESNSGHQHEAPDSGQSPDSSWKP